jgi:hypothetical protein
VILPFDKAVSEQAPKISPAFFSRRGWQQGGFSEQNFKLFRPVSERIPARIEQQNQIESRFKRVPQEPVRFPA